MAQLQSYSKSSADHDASFFTELNQSYHTVTEQNRKFEENEMNIYNIISAPNKGETPKEKVSSASNKGLKCLLIASVAIAALVAVLLLVLSAFSAFIWLEVSELKKEHIISGQRNSSDQLAVQPQPSPLENNFSLQLLKKISAIDSTLQNLNTSSGQDIIQPLELQLNLSVQKMFEELLTHENSSYLFLDRLETILNSSVDALIQQLLKNSLANRNGTQELIITLNSLQSQFVRTIDIGQYSAFPVSSCASLPPNSPSGYYWVRTSTDSAVHVYCDMTRSCGGVTGGWMRVFELDMSNSRQQCPSGLSQRNDINFRTCRRNSTSAGCSRVVFSTSRLQYSRVCGRIKGYQVGSSDTFGYRENNLGIDNYYVDGVSLTYGYPRRHIWTFAAGLDEAGTNPAANCPCMNRGTASPPSFVGNDYFCDTGSSSLYVNGYFYRHDPLWDGAGCGPLNTCCSFNTPPWFYKQLPQPTTDDIEMRVCRDQSASNEDVVVEMIDIYVR